MSDLTTRKRVTTTLDKLSKETRIPKSKLFDEAIEYLLENTKINSKPSTLTTGQATVVCEWT